MLPDGSSRALFAELPEELLTLWGFPRKERQTGRNPIAVCEAAVVLLSLWQWRHLLKGCSVLWYIDNAVSLHSIVKGMSKEVSISRVAEAICIISYRLDIHVWYEFVASKDNWSDGVSRVGFQDELIQNIAAICTPLECSSQWWTMPLAECWECPLECL